MKQFLNDDFMLSNNTGRRIYELYAQNLPIIDYHCHINAKDIAEDIHFDNITQLWLGGDHYKWRYMRSVGIDEKYITGDASDRDKFIKWCEALSTAIGNPLYHWSHLELKKYFKFNSYVTKDNAPMLWEQFNRYLTDNNVSARSIINESNVELLCTTDDPVDDLKFHKMISEDVSFKTRVLPAFRPDRFMQINNENYTNYIAQLENVSGIRIDSFAKLKEALCLRMDYFNDCGCQIADHGLTKMIFTPAGDDEIERIYSDRLKGILPSESAFDKFATALLLFVHKEYNKRGWTSQLHYGCLRDLNTQMFNRIGPNTGYDSINPQSGTANLPGFLDALCSRDALPRIIIYSLNPTDNASIDTIIEAFNDSSAVCKLQHGSAWWFNDSKTGMENHLNTLASNGSLASFVGMLTDSRSFVSYVRHDYFRRILCNYIGTLIENGEFPDDDKLIGTIVTGIAHNNAVNYFKFDL